MKKITKRENGSLRVQTVIPETSKVDPSFKHSSDINVIMAKYKKTQLWPGRQLETQYMDWFNMPDLRTSTEIVARAKSMFNELPAHVRARFKNDPSNLLDFVRDAKNQKEAVEMGLTHPSKVPAPNDDDKTTTMPGSQNDGKTAPQAS